MTLNELIEQLEDIREELGTGDGTVFIAQQPRWPLRAGIDNVVSNDQVLNSSDPVEKRGQNDVWIAVSEDGEYAPKAAWDY